jgi:hypothetical protein
VAEIASTPTSRDGSFGSLDPRVVIVPFLVAAGLSAVVAGALLVRRAGTGYRVGRTLAAAPEARLDQVVTMAHAGRARYVRTHGRIASDEEFPDESQRPLVYRRRRVQHQAPDGTWRDLDEDRAAVPFGLEDRTTFVAVDVDALGDGLVVVPREAVGTAQDLPDGAWAGTASLDPATPVRLRVEQVSSVEHATVAGVPALDAAGTPLLTAGLGRPLILTTLEQPAAMRLLGAGKRGTLMVAATLLVAGPACLALAIVAWLVGL